MRVKREGRGRDDTLRGEREYEPKDGPYKWMNGRLSHVSPTYPYVGPY